jgi:LEA14-like dessication related protein
VLFSFGCVERLADFSVRSLEGVRCTGIDSKGFNLMVRCKLANPNSLGAGVSNIRFRTFAGQHLLGKGRFQGPLEVQPKSEFLLEVPVRVSYAGLPPDFPERVKDGHLRMRTEVNLTAKTKLGSYDMHLSTKDRVKIAEAFRVAIQGPFKGEAFRIDSITLAGLKLRRVKLRIRFTARNLFAFPYRILRGAFSISINGSHFGDGKLEQPLALKPRSQATVDTVVAATHGAVGRAIAAMMGEDPRFRLKGTLWIDPIGGVDRLPVDVEADSSIFGHR